MRKFSIIYFLIMALFVLSLSGCGSSSHSGETFSLNTTTNDSETDDEDNNNSNQASTVAQVAVLQSPVFNSGDTYKLYKGATLNGMDDNKYFVNSSAMSSTGNGVTLNLGFWEKLDDTFAITNSSGVVVFAYNPDGSGNKTDGSVTFLDGGTQLGYNGLSIDAVSTGATSSVASVEYDDADIHDIVLNSDGSATYDGEEIPEYYDVWHADPDHSAEYWTDKDGNNETEDEPEYDDDVYINRDIRYLTNSISESDFSHSVKNDDETELAVYYSENISKEMAEYLGVTGPFIFATLPNGMGGGAPGEMGGNNGGTPPDGGMGGNPGEGGMGGTPPDGGMGGTPPSMAASVAATSSYYSTMTHSPETAYENPVLHINTPGTYRISGEWHGQIWIDVGKKSKESAIAEIILNGVTVSCDVAPAFVVRKAYECDTDFYKADDNDLDDAYTYAFKSFDAGSKVTENAGAKIIISDDTVNNFTGANVYRMLKCEGKGSNTSGVIDGTDVDQQKKLYKMDGAFYSFVSMVIGAPSGGKGTGTLNITSTTYEGLDSELHLTVDSGIINITAPDDGINVNEDMASVFTLNGGTLSVTSTGADGIDSNGYIVLNKGTLNICSMSENGAEGALDSYWEDGRGTYQSNEVVYKWTQYTGSNSTTPDNGTTPSTNNSTTNSAAVTTYASVEKLIEELNSESVDVISDVSTTVVIDTGKGVVTDNGRTRTISESGTTFKLDGDVCTFSGIE